jgi:hypothetical protein
MAGCPCHKTLRLLTELGATHAARMERLGANENAKEWSNKDWLDHFAEEERLLLPLLPKKVADQIYREHNEFRRQIYSTGTVNPAQILKHARWEDRLVADHFPDV